MRPLPRALLTASLVIGLGQALAMRPARAQGPGPGGSLGGYGASMGLGGAEMGVSGPVLPYAGRFGGFMPYRMGGGDLAFQRRYSSTMTSVRPSFSLSSTPDGMSSMSGGMIGPRTGMSTSGLGGSPGSGGGMRPSMPAGMGVMPPRIAYPFRQPPGLLGPASGPGMSM